MFFDLFVALKQFLCHKLAFKNIIPLLFLMIFKFVLEPLLDFSKLSHWWVYSLFILGNWFSQGLWYVIFYDHGAKLIYKHLVNILKLFPTKNDDRFLQVLYDELKLVFWLLFVYVFLQELPHLSLLENKYKVINYNREKEFKGMPWSTTIFEP